MPKDRPYDADGTPGSSEKGRDVYLTESPIPNFRLSRGQSPASGPLNF